ncbi:Serine/arginine repetitive matrix protein 2 [Xylographa carneopallida]|nr:Serine/arginine repetitive matrix protein 2 [Xylographa carneopallida]
MSQSNDPRKRSPSLGQKILTKVKKTVRSLSGNNEKRPKFDLPEPTESLAERLHREKLERNQVEGNRSNAESFLQSGRSGPRVVQTRNGPRAVQEPTRGPSPHPNRLEREAARRAADVRSTSPPRGRSPTSRERRPGTTPSPSSPRHRPRTVTRAGSRPGAIVRFTSPPRGASFFKPGSPPRRDPFPLAAVSLPRSRPPANAPRREVSWKGSRSIKPSGHLHPDRFTADAWPAPNTGVYGPGIVPGPRAPAPNTGVQAISPTSTINLAAEGLHGIRGLPITRKPFLAVIKRSPATDALRGPGIQGSRQIEPGLDVRPVSLRVSLVNPTPPPPKDHQDPDSPGVSPLSDDHDTTGYERIIADQPPVLRTPTVLRPGTQYNRFSGRALAEMHVPLCGHCNNRPLSSTSHYLCRSCEDLQAVRECPLVSPLSPDRPLLCPQCRRSAAEVPGPRFCRPCERQLDYHNSCIGDDSSPMLERPSTSPYASAPRPAMVERAHTAAHGKEESSASSRLKQSIARSEAPIRRDLAQQVASGSRLSGPFSPGIPIQRIGPVPAHRRRDPSSSGSSAATVRPTPPLKDTHHALRPNPYLMARHQHVTQHPFPLLSSVAYPYKYPHVRSPSTGNLFLSSFPPRTDSLP